jgi:hypothetical protein
MEGMRWSFDSLASAVFDKETPVVSREFDGNPLIVFHDHVGIANGITSVPTMFAVTESDDERFHCEWVVEE